MIRILATTVLLVTLTASLSSADIFKCQRPDGSFIYTDDPSQATADCRLERVISLPDLGKIPDVAPLSTAPLDSGGATPQPTGGDSERLFKQFKLESSELIAQFEDARRGAFRSYHSKDRQSSRRDLIDIRIRKKALLNEVEQSELTKSEKQELQELLSAITGE